MDKKIFVLGFEIDLDNIAKCHRLERMNNDERIAAYEKEENPGGKYELRDWFDQLNGGFIDTENYDWILVEQ